MARNPTFREKLTRWEVLSSNLRANLPDLPSLAAPQAAFANIVAEGLSLMAGQEAALGELRSFIERRKDLERRGDHAREFLAAALRDALGVANPLLLQFNVRPRISRRRRPEATKLAAQPTDAAPEETPPPAVADEPQIH